MSQFWIDSIYIYTCLCLNNHIFTLILIHIWFHLIHSYFIKTNSFMVSSHPFIFHQNNKHYCYIIILLIFQIYFFFMNHLLSSNVLSNNGFIFIICYRSHNHEVIAHFLSYRLLDNPVSLSLITTLMVTKCVCVCVCVCVEFILSQDTWFIILSMLIKSTESQPRSDTNCNNLDFVHLFTWYIENFQVKIKHI
jgi:hypothetical protein